MNIPKRLEVLRDAQLGTNPKHENYRLAFREGFNFAVEELSKGVEFDDGACDAEIARDGYAEYLGGRGYDEPQAFRNGAHWMFQQCAARVGQAKLFEQYCSGETIRTVAINPSDSECATTRLDSAGKDE